MTLALSVDEPAWRTHLDRFTDGMIDALVPVVKGNGYGFGRPTLIAEAQRLGVSCIAVGTIHELPGRGHADGLDVVVLTPTLDALAEEVHASVTLTVGSESQLAHLRDAGFAGQVIVKLASSMQRYGCSVDELKRLDVEPAAYSVHPPLAGDDDAHRAEIERWLGHLDPAVPVQVSHLTPTGFERMRSDHPTRTFQLRSGTGLWHGDKSMLRLSADVVDTRSVRAADTVGYRQVPVAHDGTMVMIGAGSAHGVAPLSDGRSPFHYANTRLTLIEAPHMHTSMALVATGQPTPSLGETVDVQRPLTQSWVDRVIWVQ
jgi:alanine racemase